GKIQNALGALRGFSDLIQKNMKAVEQKQKVTKEWAGGWTGGLVATKTEPRLVEIIPFSKVSMPKRKPEESSNGEPLEKAERSILGVLAQYPEGCLLGKLALLAGYRQSGGFRNALSCLRSRGY